MLAHFRINSTILHFGNAILKIVLQGRQIFCHSSKLIRASLQSLVHSVSGTDCGGEVVPTLHRILHHLMQGRAGSRRIAPQLKGSAIRICPHLIHKARVQTLASGAVVYHVYWLRLLFLRKLKDENKKLLGIKSI